MAQGLAIAPTAANFVTNIYKTANAVIIKGRNKDETSGKQHWSIHARNPDDW
ncbi:MAG: hypothetical protein ACFCA4_14225 [Cyanophyceae cyanobacterium]